MSDVDVNADLPERRRKVWVMANEAIAARGITLVWFVKEVNKQLTQVGERTISYKGLLHMRNGGSDTPRAVWRAACVVLGHPEWEMLPLPYLIRKPRADRGSHKG